MGASDEKVKCLMIRASSSACAGEESLVRDVLKGLDIELRSVEWISYADFVSQIGKGEQYQFIYLGAHADGTGFGENSAATLHRWETLAEAICNTDCISPGGTLFMGCCRGGMKTVAFKIMKQCGKVDQICGPFWTLKGNDITMAFHAFVKALIRDKEDPAMAADRATESSRCKFLCYERQDLAGELEMLAEVQEVKWSIELYQMVQDQLRKEVSKLTSAVEKLTAQLPGAGDTGNTTQPPPCGPATYS